MTRIRVLHHLAGATRDAADFASYAKGTREYDGLLEAEAYVSISDPTDLALVELWSDQHAYGAHWDAVLADPSRDLIRAESAGDAPTRVTSEFYRQQTFHPDRVWVSDEYRERSPKIFWPARGAVRIVIAMNFDNSDAIVPFLLADEKATRREPGCQVFGWYRSLEFPGHVLLLELWDDQAIYDAHWHLRLKTGAPSGMQSPARQYGSNTVEFYRQQQFKHFYDRWLPAEVSQRSETVIWSD